MKKFTALFLSLVMLVSVLTAFPATVGAASYSDAAFFAKFNYAANPKLSQVKAFVDANDFDGAKAALLQYFKDRKQSSTISGFGITRADEFYGMAVLPMRNILTGPYEFDMWQAEFTVTSSSFSDYEVDVTDRIAQELNNGAVSFMLFAGDKQQYPVYVKSKEAGSNAAPRLSVTYEIDGSENTTLITCDNDTYISSQSTDATYGEQTELHIKEDGTGSDSTGSNTRRTYINFPLESCKNSSIISAKLLLNAAYAADCTTGDKDVLVINVGDTMWSENSLTWEGTRGSIYSYQNASVPTWNASAPNADSEYHNVTSRFWFGKPMAYEYLSYLEDPELYNSTHPYSDVYPGADFGPKLVELMDAFASQQAYGYTRTLETGERLNRWVDIVDAFLETDVFDTRLDEFCNILSFMWGDCNYLGSLDIANGSYWWSNWRIVANAGFFKAVEYLCEFSSHDTWRNKVEYNVEYTFDLLYNDDFSFTEAGPSYAAWCVKLFGDCLKSAQMSGNPMSAVFTEKVKYAARNALESYYPNGYDTNIGDSNYRNQMYYFEMLDTVFGGNDNIIASYVSGEDQNADYLTKFYHNVNTAYMRNSWDPDEAVYINYTNNPADGHYHPDSNQVIMYAYGSPLLVDSGRYSYSSTNEIYTTLRTAPSHNTIEAVGIDMDKHTAATSANSMLYANTNSAFDFASSEQHGYSGVSHTRNVFFNKQGFGIVTDYVTGSASRTYRQNWHFMPSSNAVASGNVIATSFYNAPDITLAAASSAGASVNDGYHSADYGLVAKSEYGSFEKTGATVKLDTLLYPDKANVTTAVSATDLAPDDNSKAAMEISIDGETSYYYVENTSDSDGTFGSFTTDAKMAYVSNDEYMIVSGKSISDKIVSKSTIVSMGVILNNNTLSISGEKLISDNSSATAIKIYAPNATSVTLNGEAVPFTKDGNYIYAVASSVAESITGATAKIFPDKDGFVASTSGNEGADSSNAGIIQSARSWQNRNAYMAFDLSDFEDKSITSAKLYLTPTEVANSPSNLHFYYMDYGTWTRNNLSFILDSSKMPTHTSTSGGFTGFAYRWSGSVASASLGTTLSLTSNLSDYLAAGGNHKFTWAILSESGSIKFHSINSSSAALRPYLELTYNYQSSTEEDPTVTVNTYYDGVASETTVKKPLGSLYLLDVDDVVTTGGLTYYIDQTKSNISTIVKSADNELNVYYHSAEYVDVSFTDILGNTLADDVTITVNPNLESYTYNAPESIEKDGAIYLLDSSASNLVCRVGFDLTLSAVYKKTAVLGSENLVANGSFEDEAGNFSLEGWLSASTGAAFGSPYTTNHCYALNSTTAITNNTSSALSTVIPDGTWALGTRWNDSTDGLCSLKRYVAVESGKTYRISYDVKHKTGAEGTYLKTSLVASATAGEANTTYPGYIGTEWTTIERTFTADDNTDNVLFLFRWLGDSGNTGNGPFWYFDNFSIREVTPFEYTTITLDGKEVITEGSIALGEAANGGYELPADVIGYTVTGNSGISFCNAGVLNVSQGDIIETTKINVKMIDGAQVRYGGGLDAEGKISSGNGLRFISQIDRSNVGDQVTSYGVRITAEASSNSAEVTASTFQDDAETIFTTAITDLAPSNYNRKFTATPFVTVEYSDNTTAKIYASSSVTRSIYHVAVGLLKNSSDDSDGNDPDYDTSDFGLYDVLNAYVNMVGIRLTLNSDGSITERTTGSGSYSGDLFFNVTSDEKSEGCYTITIAPITNNFNNAVTIMSYWPEFVRINNNNSIVKDQITNIVSNPDGSITFDFTVPASE